MFNFKKKTLDPILAEGFRTLDAIERDRDGNKVEKLLALEESMRAQDRALDWRESLKGFAGIFSGILAAGASTYPLFHTPSQSQGELGQKVAAFFCICLSGFPVAAKNILNKNRAATDIGVFNSIVEGHLSAAVEKYPEQAAASPLYQKRFGAHFNTASSKDERPARLRARVGAEHIRRIAAKPV